MAQWWDHVHTGYGRALGDDFETHTHESTSGGSALAAPTSIVYSGSANTRVHSHAGPSGAITLTESSFQEHLLFGLGIYSVYAKLEVDRDGAGTMQDLTDLGGWDWLVSADWQENVDAPVASAKFTLAREAVPYASRGAVSLAPLMEGSSLNQDGGSYTPMLDLARNIQLSTAMMPFMSLPASANWVLKFDGYIDTIDTGDAGEILLECRDKGAFIQDCFILASDVYGSDAGSSIESEIQALLDDNLGALAPTLYTPVSPGWMLHRWLQAQTSLADALNTLASQIGWSIGYRWRSDLGRFDLTLWTPDRTQTVADFYVSPGQYRTLEQCKLDVSPIRNVVCVEYIDENRESHKEVVTDATSIARYGGIYRYMYVGEASTSNIDTSTEAQAMANAMLSDLSAPIVEQNVRMPYASFVQLAALGCFFANGCTYDTDKTLAVTALHHSLSRDDASTTLGARGKPSGGFERWLAKEIRTDIRPRIYGDLTMSSSPSYPGTSGEYNLVFDTAVSDDSGMLDATYGTLLIPQTGLYHVILMADLTDIETTVTVSKMGLLLWSYEPAYSGFDSTATRLATQTGIVSNVAYTLKIDAYMILRAGQALQGLVRSFGGDRISVSGSSQTCRLQATRVGL